MGLSNNNIFMIFKYTKQSSQGNKRINKKTVQPMLNIILFFHLFTHKSSLYKTSVIQTLSKVINIRVSSVLSLLLHQVPDIYVYKLRQQCWESWFHGRNDKQGNAGGCVVGAVELVLVGWNGPISLEE